MSFSIKSFSIIVAAILFTAFSCSKPPSLPQPSVEAHSKEGKLIVTLSVPDHHHAYLDSGTEGNLIPVSFDWAKWSANGQNEPQLISKPEGALDQDTGAYILHGNGNFTFETKDTNKQNEFRVRVQICDEIKGICYRPSWHEVTPKG